MIDLFSLTTVQMILYVIMLCMATMSISFFMELYKKSFRKNASSIGENKVVGIIISAIVSYGLIKLGMFHPIFSKIGAHLIFDECVLVVGLYIAQMQMDMRVLKKIMKLGTSSLLKKAGLSDAEITTIMNAIEEASANKEEK